MEEGARSRVWVNRLQGVLKSMNSDTKRMTEKEPVEALGMKEVGVTKIDYKRPVGHDEVRLPPEVQVRYLLLQENIKEVMHVVLQIPYGVWVFMI